jgi:DNA polymerase III subunit chi
MPKIDFYILADTLMNARLQLACRLIEKAYQQKHQVYIQMQNQAEAEYFDRFLWTYRDDSFIPHNLYGDPQNPRPPIQIGFDQTPEDHRDILINLSDDVPSFYQPFSRILEIILNDPAGQSRARDRYRFYRDLSYEINTHKL